MRKGESLDLKLSEETRLDRFGRYLTYLGATHDSLKFEFYRRKSGQGEISVPIENADNGDISVNGFKFNVNEYDNSHIKMEYLGRAKHP